MWAYDQLFDRWIKETAIDDGQDLCDCSVCADAFKRELGENFHQVVDEA